jgi:hypothetical protein
MEGRFKTLAFPSAEQDDPLRREPNAVASWRRKPSLEVGAIFCHNRGELFTKPQGRGELNLTPLEFLERSGIIR